MPAGRRPPLPRDRAGRFVTWSGADAVTPARWELPATESDVVDLVRRARAERRRLRVVGAGHSFSRIALPEDVAVSLDRCDQGALHLDRDRGVASVPGGMRLHDLTAALAVRGLSLPVVGSIQAQSVAGAIATGTHGSSVVHGNLATLVTGLRLVTGHGEVVTLDDGDERLEGARVHLGALGVVTRVTVRVVPAVRLRQSIEQVPVAAVPDRLEEFASSAEWVKVWWLAHAPTAQVIRYERTTAPETRRPSVATQRWVDERVLHRSVFPALVALQRRRPAITAGMNRRLSQVYLGAPVQVGRDMLVLNTPMPMRHRETEAALPLTAAPEAVAQVLDLFRDGRPAVSFPLEIRFVRGDDGWLSPAYGADTCQVGAYTTNGPDCSPYFDAFWQVMHRHGARPHWGKELDHEASTLRALYPRFDRFLHLRDDLDPDRVFGSAFLTRVLGS